MARVVQEYSLTEAVIATFDRHGRTFDPDRLRVTLGQRIAALHALGQPRLCSSRGGLAFPLQAT